MKGRTTESADAAGEVLASLVDRARGGEALFAAVMRRYNQRLYRIARAILRDDGEAEDVCKTPTCTPSRTSFSSKTPRAS